jgi:hypothetical protein
MTTESFGNPFCPPIEIMLIIESRAVAPVLAFQCIGRGLHSYCCTPTNRAKSTNVGLRVHAGDTPTTAYGSRSRTDRFCKKFVTLR